MWDYAATTYLVPKGHGLLVVLNGENVTFLLERVSRPQNWLGHVKRIRSYLQEGWPRGSRWMIWFVRLHHL